MAVRLSTANYTGRLGTIGAAGFPDGLRELGLVSRVEDSRRYPELENPTRTTSCFGGSSGIREAITKSEKWRQRGASVVVPAYFTRLPCLITTAGSRSTSMCLRGSPCTTITSANFPASTVP